MRKSRPRLVLTGSGGLLGSALRAGLAGDYRILELSRRLGHDLADEAFVKKWFARNPAEYLVVAHGLNDHVDGGRKGNSLFDVSLESVSAFLNVNVLSAFSVCREFARHRCAKGIVTLSSIYGLVSPVPELYGGREKHIGYSLSKTADIGLTRHLAVHLAPRVRVNCVVPGGVRHKQPRAFLRRYSVQTPMRRMMEKDELVGTVAFLCSERSSYMTGAVLVLDGGRTVI